MHSKSLLFIAALLAGALLPLASAPLSLWPLAMISPALLLWILLPKTIHPKKAFLIGWGYGIGMFGMGVSWVYVSIHDFGHTEIPLAVLLTATLALGLALFPALQCYFLKRFFRGNTITFCLLGFPSAWVLFEWIRSWILTGFPWLYLGTTQLDTPLAGYAPILSVYGVSLAVLLTSGACVTFIKGGRTAKLLASALVILLWVVGAVLRPYPFTTPIGRPYTVSLVQGNIKPFDKFAAINPLGTTEKIYGHLTQTLWGRDLILWPESAIPLPLPYAQPYIDKLQAIAASHHSTLITGIQVITPQHIDHNSLIALGNGSGLYHKYHLLPFGDFLPFDHWLRGLTGFFDIPMSSFTAGPEEQPLIQAGDLKLDPLICYEIAYPELIRSTLRNADAIITLSEDGWFGGSWGPHQHLEIARVRAVETGRYVLRATTSGITAIIDPKGKLVATIPQFQATVLNGEFRSMQGETPWIKIGLWPLLIVLLFCFILPGRSFINPFKKNSFD